MSIFATPIDCASTIPAPSPAVTHSERSSTVENTTNPVDDFFGYTLASSRTRDSRHDRRISTAESALAPPPYDEAPEYTQKLKEPVTLAMYLFKFGFRTSLHSCTLDRVLTLSDSIPTFLDNGRRYPPVASTGAPCGYAVCCVAA